MFRLELTTSSVSEKRATHTPHGQLINIHKSFIKFH